MITVEDFLVRPVGADRIRASCAVTEVGGARTELWFEISGLPPDGTVDVADAFLGPCLLFAMKRNTGLRFAAPVSDRLAQQASDIAYVVGTQLGYDTKPAIEMPIVRAVERRAKGGITGFSAGVDSWFSLQTNLIECPDSPNRLAYLLVNDVGANTTAEKRADVLRRAEIVAAEFGLGLVSVVSNMAEFLEMGFEKTHTVRNGSVAHLLSPICDTFYYSSADTYASSGVFPTYSMAYADTILLPLLSSDAIVLRSTGSAFTRAEKTRAILDIPRIGERLDVCADHRHTGSKVNCGRCWKCLRTELTLEAFGVLRQFEPSFDLDAYAIALPDYIRSIASSDRPAERETFALAAQAGLIRTSRVARARGRAVKFLKRMGLKRPGLFRRRG